ncbi:MAG: hypoxanthine phosphoribosyltransferase [Chitinophagaceae bacterium]|nr:hypoxanthine phosphoribosyltransferase [Chitinophagaceae bacterium]
MNKQILDKSFKPYLTSSEISLAIQKIANQINLDYQDKNPLFIAILNGSFIFASDLFKKIDIPAEISFIKLASYQGTKSTGNVITAIGLETDLFDRHVVVLEDIIDTGKTLSAFLPQLQHQQPKSLKVCTLLHKKEATKYPITIDYLGFEIPDLFVVGYGLDYNGYGRNLDQIMQIDE